MAGSLAGSRAGACVKRHDWVGINVRVEPAVRDGIEGEARELPNQIQVSELKSPWLDAQVDG